MAETALSMAATLVRSALGVASAAARQEVGLLLGVHDDIGFINAQLKMMSAFLRTTNVAEGNAEVLKAYLELIRDLAYDTEDCLEEFMVSIKHPSMLQQCFNLGARHRIAIKIRAIKQRIQELNQMRKMYNLIQLTDTISDDMKGDFQVTRNFAALYIQEAQLVGFQRPKVELLEMTSSKTDGRKVVSIVGMGGLGKTTLPKKVYDSKELHERFVNFAWITVSQSFSIMEILKDLIKQLLGENSLEDLLKKHQGVTLLGKHCTDLLREQLEGKRYFVVLDDLWTIEAWNSIQFAFPEHSSELGCVVVTTRITEVAQNADEDKILDEILKKCGGLPLAIVTIGGLLANKGINEWKSLRDQLPSQLARGDPSVEALKQVVTLSYNHLPSHLKPCFLYLNLFPEDFEISRRHLVNRWIAEGFISIGTAQATLEDFADNYFYELISRSMIQPSKLDVQGNVKTCRVHDIVHDIAVTISRQENHVLLVDEQTRTAALTKESIRHVSCFGTRKWNGMDLSRVRSFTLFSEPARGPIAPLCLPQLKMLRVLDLKNARFKARQQDIEIIGLLLHLKYLHFHSESSVYTLPGSMGNLHGLQTLDIRKSNFASLPTEITKLQDLRSLRCSRIRQFKGFSSCWSDSSGIRVPRGMGSLRELQILEKVDIERTSRKAIKELGELTQLRKLVVRGRGDSNKKCKAFCEAAEKLSSLRSLNVGTKEPLEEAGVLDMLVSFTSPLPCLERLKLKGFLQQVPAWVGECVSLVKIDLKCCKLKELGALAQLPNLIQLRLLEDAYDAEKLVFCRDAFPKLRILSLHYYNCALREVTFEQSTSPNMETIDIKYCDLASGINGIENLPKLKEVYIQGGILAKQDMLKEEAGRHRNHP
ncbi:hypothetical protein SETIT_4G127000v2, partial [Setaria italica]